MMTTAIPESPTARLRRKATAEALTEAGFPVSEKTLATKAVRGGGPPYQTFGRTVLYRWADALAWAEGRLSPPRRSTSEADPQRHAAA
jgi:hypothetical protein